MSQQSHSTLGLEGPFHLLSGAQTGGLKAGFPKFRQPGRGKEDKNQPVLALYCGPLCNPHTLLPGPLS